VLVVGAGAAGLVAAIFARRAGAAVTLLESTPEPGRKILISGGGRCNVLPSRFEPERFVSEDSRTATRLLKAWRLESVRAFFEDELRVPLAIESESGKVFPVSNRARDVRDALTAEAERSGVRIRRGVRVADIARPLTVSTADGASFSAGAIVLATGGLSIPKTGSDGAGLSFARRLGHRVVEPYPALTPLKSASAAHRALAGVSVSATLRVGVPSRAVAAGGFLFTHGGYSGPAVLDVSHHVVRDADSPLRAAWGAMPAAAWEEKLRSAGAQTVAGAVARYLPSRLAEVLLADVAVDRQTRLAQLRREQRLRLVEALGDSRLPVSGHEGFARAEVTGGGVALSEVDPVTLESRRVPGLYLCGEILDAFGPIGGHNFRWAWVTGRSAGLAAGSRRGS
jgi:predicted Rossmann fold flavoprotein